MTPLFVATSSPTPVNLLVATPEPGCEIPLQVVSWKLEPSVEAAAEVHAEWRSAITRTLEAVVIDHDPAQQLIVLQPTNGPWHDRFWLRYSHSAPPIEVGRRYRFTSHQDVPGQPPAGWAIRIDDEAGLLYFAASVRETPDAERRLLGGDTAGFLVRQESSTCRYAIIDPCGYELRAVPVRIERGDQALVLNIGQSGVLAGDPAYRATVLASHVRFWREDRRCADPTDTVLAYELVRQSAP